MEPTTDTAKTETCTVWLDTPEDWHVWILLVKSAAQTDKADVWAMIDPSKEEEDLMPEPEEPFPPLASTIDPTVTSVTQLKGEHLQQWNAGYQEYTHLLKRYERVRSTLNRVKNFITSTITRRNIGYITDKETPYDMLISLRLALSPTSEMHEGRIIQEYKALQVWNKRESIETWIRKWETTYRDAFAAGLPEVQGTRPLRDFLIAVGQYDRSYSRASISMLERDIAKEETPTFAALIREFRTAIPSMAAQETSASASAYTHSAFSTDSKGNSFKDSPATSTPTSTQRPQGSRMCACGREHIFGVCYYYNAEIRPSGWKPNAEIQKKVKEVLKNPQMKAFIKKSI